MKLCNFISRPNIEGQKTAADEIMYIIYHSIPTTWKNKMIEQGFNYADCIIKEMTDFFENRVENLKTKENQKQSSTVAKKAKDKKSTKKRKQKNSDSSVVESSKESSVEHRPVKNTVST